MGKVHGSLARAGKVKSQTPKVEPQEKKKTPKGRAKKRITYTRRFVNVTMTGGKRKVCFSGNGEALMRVYADGIITDEPESYYVMEVWNWGCRGEERCEMCGTELREDGHCAYGWMVSRELRTWRRGTAA